jgi:hypothetical protein
MEYPVAVYPALFGILNVVINNKFINRINQLKIPYIGQKIGLHDG